MSMFTTEDKALPCKLHNAVEEGHAKVARMLIDHGADVNARAGGNTAALQIA